MSIEIISKQAILNIKPKAKADRNYRTNNLDDAYEDGFDDALNTIAEMPAAHMILFPNDTQEKQHGRWMDYRRMGIDGTFHWFRQCSECLYEREDDNEDKDTPYCPNCGAKMDLEGDIE